MAIIYRIVKYEGEPEWLEKQLGNSFPLGRKVISPGNSITVAAIDPEDELSVTLARDKFYNFIASLGSNKPKGFADP